MQTLRILLLAIVWLGVAVPVAYSQDEAANETEAEEAATPAEDDTAEADAVSEVLETDNESYRDIDDEDFRPSEEIPADQSIAFPTDI